MKRKTRIFSILILSVILLCASALFACTNKSSENEYDGKIKLNVTDLKLRIYSEYQLSVKADAEYELKFSSEDTSIASVTNEGVITAMGVGQTKINVTHNTSKATCVVTVYETTEIPTLTIKG